MCGGITNQSPKKQEGKKERKKVFRYQNPREEVGLSLSRCKNAPKTITCTILGGGGMEAEQKKEKNTKGQKIFWCPAQKNPHPFKQLH